LGTWRRHHRRYNVGNPRTASAASETIVHRPYKCCAFSGGMYVCVCVCLYIIRVHNTRLVGGPRYVLNYYLIKPLSLRGSYSGRTRRYSLGSRVGNGRIDLSLEGLAHPHPRRTGIKYESPLPLSYRRQRRRRRNPCPTRH